MSLTARRTLSRNIDQAIFESSGQRERVWKVQGWGGKKESIHKKQRFDDEFYFTLLIKRIFKNYPVKDIFGEIFLNYTDFCFRKMINNI